MECDLLSVLLMYPRILLHDADMHSAYLLSKDGWMYTSVVSKLLKMSSDFFLSLVALPLWFSNTALLLQNSNGKRSLSLGWTWKPSVLPIRLLTPHTRRRYGGEALADNFPPSG